MNHEKRKNKTIKQQDRKWDKVRQRKTSRKKIQEPLKIK